MQIVDRKNPNYKIKRSDNTVSNVVCALSLFPVSGNAGKFRNKNLTTVGT